MRARRVIALVVLFLVSTPFALLGLALMYERWEVQARQERLSALAARLSSETDRARWPEAAAQESTWVRLFARDGQVTWDSHTEKQAEFLSPVARGFDTVFPGEDRRVASDFAALASAPASNEVLEIEGGRAIVVRVPLTISDGQTLVLDTILRRGIRQLVLVKSELLRLLVLQAIVALALAALLGRVLVRPLETLEARARVFPLAPIADEVLLARRDELGELARTFNTLVTSLDARWKDSVTLAGDLTHELKNPLATIAAASERLANAKELTPEKRAEWTRLIEAAVERLQHATEALLDEVKTAARARHAERKTVDAKLWLEGVLEKYRAQHSGWSFELEVSTPHLRVDNESWAAAVRNLLDNALVQPSDRHVVRLELTKVGERTQLDVIDFGPGVSEGNREKIFQRFFTQRPEGTPRGAGIGLSIVQGIAQAHGGSLELCPQRPGEGARFRLIHD